MDLVGDEFSTATGLRFLGTFPSATSNSLNEKLFSLHKQGRHEHQCTRCDDKDISFACMMASAAAVRASGGSFRKIALYGPAMALLLTWYTAACFPIGSRQMPHGVKHRRPRQVRWRASWHEISLVVGCRSPSSYATPITRAESYRGFHMLDLCDRIVEYALPQNSAPSSRLTSNPRVPNVILQKAEMHGLN